MKRKEIEEEENRERKTSAKKSSKEKNRKVLKIGSQNAINEKTDKSNGNDRKKLNELNNVKSDVSKIIAKENSLDMDHSTKSNGKDGNVGDDNEFEGSENDKRLSFRLVFQTLKCMINIFQLVKKYVTIKLMLNVIKY